MSEVYVIDTNIVIKWFLKEDEGDVSKFRRIYSLMMTGKIDLIAPDFLLVEVLNILLKRKKLNKTKIFKLLERLRECGIKFESLWEQVVSSKKLDILACKYGVTSYDALCLLLAKEKKCKLLTLDSQLLKIKNLATDADELKL